MKTYLKSALFLFLTVVVLLPSLQAAEPKFSVLARSSSAPEGSLPTVLIQGRDGNLYGITDRGGSWGQGTVFKLTPAGERTIVVSFKNEETGGFPVGLVEGTDGNFYGATRLNTNLDGGSIFKLTPDGVITTLASFHGYDQIYQNIILGEDGALYGTTGKGVSFKVTTAGVLTTGVPPHLPA